MEQEWRWVALKFHVERGNIITVTDIDPDATVEIYMQGYDYGRCDG